MNRRQMLKRLAVMITASPLLWDSRALDATVLAQRAARRVGVVVHRLDRAAIALLRSLDIREVRYTLYWNEWERDAGYRRRIGDEIRSAADAGIDLLIVVHQPPDTSFRNRVRTHDAFARFMTERVRQFPQVSAWQLYNEADVGFAGLDVFGAHSGRGLFDQGRGYADMLATVAPAMRSADRRVRIIANPCATDGREWARGVIANGGRDHIDAWALNCYGFPVLLAVQEKVAAFRQAIGDDPLWITEFGMERAVIAPGWPSSARDFARYHLEAWRDTTDWVQRTDSAERMYGYVLRGHGDFDIVRQDGTLTPAAEWVREHNRRVG